MHYQIIAVDVDGTLLTPAHTLSPRVRRAVRAAREHGIHIALATGKLLRSVGTLVEELRLAGPQITCNGAVTVDAAGGAPVEFIALAAPVRWEALAALRETAPDLGIAWYTPDAIYTDAPMGPLDAVLAAYHEPPLRHVPALDESLPTPAKFLITGSAERLAAVRAAISARLGAARVIGTTPDFLEVMDPRATKGEALGAVMRLLDVPRERVLALGDGENDMDLLAAAGCGVAMGNAIPALRAQAAYVTASNDEDGAALVIEAVLDRRPLGAVTGSEAWP
jgi:Cof subfamily protein (haloacid dehalogenase superfamily)